MVHYAIIVAAALLISCSSHARDTEPLGPSSLACETDVLMENSEEELELWQDLRIERAWTAIFITGVTGTTIGSLIAGAGCLNHLGNSSELCTAGIGVSAVFGLVLVCGATLGIVYAGYNCYVESYNENIQTRPKELEFP